MKSIVLVFALVGLGVIFLYFDAGQEVSVVDEFQQEVSDRRELLEQKKYDLTIKLETMQAKMEEKMATGETALEELAAEIQQAKAALIQVQTGLEDAQKSFENGENTVREFVDDMQD